MQLHQLKPKHKREDKKRVGRGGKRGTYCGRGMKGQKARAGSTLQPAIRRFIKRYPKLRGYKFKPKQDQTEIVNVEDLEYHFESDQKVTPKALIEKGLIRRIEGKVPEVKILGKGEITKSLVVEGCECSKGARDEIEKAGGYVS